MTSNISEKVLANSWGVWIHEATKQANPLVISKSTSIYSLVQHKDSEDHMVSCLTTRRIQREREFQAFKTCSELIISLRRWQWITELTSKMGQPTTAKLVSSVISQKVLRVDYTRQKVLSIFRPHYFTKYCSITKQSWFGHVQEP